MSESTHWPWRRWIERRREDKAEDYRIAHGCQIRDVDGKPCPMTPLTERFYVDGEWWRACPRHAERIREVTS